MTLSQMINSYILNCLVKSHREIKTEFYMNVKKCILKSYIPVGCVICTKILTIPMTHHLKAGDHLSEYLGHRHTVPHCRRLLPPIHQVGR